WFGWSIAPVGWERPPLWDAVAGDYATADGWLRLHTNAPHHRRAALDVLGCAADRAAVAQAVARWQGAALEAAVVEHGGCAALMRSADDWRAHPQGLAVAAEPLIHVAHWPAPGAAAWPATGARPLAGLKVLDLTRVIAGPVATRFLAGYGADVLRIDPPDWNEPGVIADVTLGKHCARLDLHRAPDRARFEALLAQADVLVHGYRPDALARLGYGEAFRRRHNPGLIDVCLDAWGWTGPLAGRRGFDSLVQMGCGIAERGMRAQGGGKPAPLPVQALDHATGYLMAAAVVRGLIARLTERRAMQARLSLARTAALLMAYPATGDEARLADAEDDDWSPAREQTDWGPARRLKPPVALAGVPMAWPRGASALGSSPAQWPRP
ncbi:MAG: CoA transferase, partial [Duganella sp.]